jgi:uncharacterized protein YabN with tetrapyrrole methylase and pyrophosphatase domain
MSALKGTLVVVGTGIESLGQMTPAARSELRRAQRVFFLAADALTEGAVRSLHPKAVSLRDHYAVGKHRLITYAQMVDTILADVRRGLRVCFALYGHPGVFALPAHAAVTLARSEGYRATMLPGVSADACLIADLGIDPSANGWQSYEATDFLVRRRRADPTAGLVLWQIGVVGRLDYQSGAVNREKLEVLTEALLEQYPRRHVVTLYEASALPGFPPSIEKVQLGSMHRADVTPVTTMYVPPARRAKLDRKMMARLGITQADSIHCLRAPNAASVAK